MILKRDFYNRESDLVARELLGKIISVNNVSGKIVETEAYFTENDKACHTFSRKNAKDFFLNNKPGTAYVYFNYGMYWLFNVLTKDGAVLIRALEPMRNTKLMCKRRNTEEIINLTSGPGKLTQALKIDKKFHGMDLIKNKEINILDNNESFDIIKSSRIGISKEKNRLLRFYIKDNKFISKLR